MILVIDNYDSFTYNLVQYLGELGATYPLAQELQVYRNDAISLDQIRALNPDGIVISPGPGTPNESGICLEVIQTLGSEFPILGVCLGHQSIGQVFGGKVIRAKELMHGKTSKVFHNNEGLFAGLPNPFVATRYHSLIVDRASLPETLEVTAWLDDHDATIMGLRHKEFARIQGVQFHPESILTDSGKEILANFLDTLESD
ncbi:MAG: aminodeoxychorismate/anthranilate synthase component II [Synechococcaceae cyanobacterium RL_1_2]|nr:aminodeoxychorismate/anthranilate synthase component II [Synechococcaceae cyanobacterium RL_1_2]